MTIKILNSFVYQGEEGNNEGRHVNIIISDGITHYVLGIGGLSLIGDLQSILEAEEAELWIIAVAKDNQRTTRQVRQLIYNSVNAGGWSRDIFQEAIIERIEGDSTKFNALQVKRDAISTNWPL